MFPLYVCVCVCVYIYIYMHVWLPSGSAVKNPPAVQEMQVQCLDWEYTLDKGSSNPLQYSCWKSAIHGVANELDMTEGLNNNVYIYISNFNGRKSLMEIKK